jgi:hypothetical protein
MDQRLWAAVIIALAFMGLVALMFVLAVTHDFATVWAGVGTVVGVVTGAIPSFFFGAKANQKDKDLNALLAEAPPGLAQQAKSNWPGSFK